MARRKLPARAKIGATVAEIVAAAQAREDRSWHTVILPKSPSVNGLFRNVTARDGKRGGRVPTKQYRAWRAEAGRALLMSRPPRLRAAYELEIELGRRKGSDLDNYAKGVSDLLVALKVVRDDSECARLVLTWANDLPSRMCRVRFRAYVCERSAQKGRGV